VSMMPETSSPSSSTSSRRSSSSSSSISSSSNSSSCGSPFRDRDAHILDVGFSSSSVSSSATTGGSSSLQRLPRGGPLPRPAVFPFRVLGFVLVLELLLGGFFNLCLDRLFRHAAGAVGAEAPRARR